MNPSPTPAKGRAGGANVCGSAAKRAAFLYNRRMLIRSVSIRSVVVSTWLLVAFQAGAREFAISPASDIVGQVEVIAAKYEDTFVDLARHYDVGFEELRRANPDVDPWLPGEGTEIISSTPTS